MADTLEELNNFLKSNDKSEVKRMVMLRDELMKNEILATSINTFIKNRPKELGLTDQQMDHVTWVLVTYLMSLGIIKIRFKK